METLKELNKISDWRQDDEVHCPYVDCKGVLLVNDNVRALKCSDCAKYFDEIIELREKEE